MLCDWMKTSLDVVNRFRECKNGEKECPFLCKSCKNVINYVQYVVKVMNMTSEEAKKGMEAYCKVMAPVLIDEATVSILSTYFFLLSHLFYTSYVFSQSQTRVYKNALFMRMFMR